MSLVLLSFLPNGGELCARKEEAPVDEADFVE